MTRLKFSILSLGLLLSQVALAEISKQEFEKTETKTFAVNNGAELALDLNFAEVEIENWNKDEVWVEIKLISEARNQEQADKDFKKTEISLKGGGSEVSISCNLSSNKGKSSYNSDDFKIIVKIKAPAHMKVDGHLAFSTAVLPSFDGTVDLNAEFSSISAGDLSHPESELNCSYGEFTMGRFGGQEISCEFGELRIASLENSAEISSSYGTITIEKMHENCTDLEIDNSFGSIEVNMASGVTYEIEANMSFGSVSCDNLDKTFHSKDFTSEEFKGTAGSGSKKGKIEANTSFGDIKIK